MISFFTIFIERKSVIYNKSPIISSLNKFISVLKVIIPFSIALNKSLLNCSKSNFPSYILSKISYKISIFSILFNLFTSSSIFSKNNNVVFENFSKLLIIWYI